MNALDAVPERSEDIEETSSEKGIHLVRDRGKNASFAMKILLWAHQTSRFHRIDIEDPVGVRAWELIDGKTSVGEIAEIIWKEFGAEEQFRDTDRDRMEHQTIQFLRMLYAARLIHYSMPRMLSMQD